jgi:pimeloyl-ACP methyl ester carboxylesterase
MPVSTHDGVEIYYEVSGAGPDLVFIHANPFDHRLWTYQVAAFSERYRCINVDLRGYGRSTKVETPYTLADMKNDVLAVCRKEGVTRAIFCGCSVGSGIALMTGLDHPDMTRALILVGGNAKGSVNVKKRAEMFSTTSNLEADLEGYIRELVAPDFPKTARGKWLLSWFTARAPVLSGKAIAQVHRARGAADMSGRLGEVRMPVHVVNGAHDNSLAAGTETAKGIAHARHAVIPGTGHACPLEDPEAFCTAMDAFLHDNGL